MSEFIREDNHFKIKSQSDEIASKMIKCLQESESLDDFYQKILNRLGKYNLFDVLLTLGSMGCSSFEELYNKFEGQAGERSSETTACQPTWG